MKKIYLKPDAEYVKFYSEEDITSELPGVDEFGQNGGLSMAGSTDDLVDGELGQWS